MYGRVTKALVEKRADGDGGVSVYVRRQGKHTRVHLLSAFLRANAGGGLTNDSEVSSRGNRRISGSMCEW